MRKIIRKKLRYMAKKQGVSPQKFIHSMWDEMQTEKVGAKKRLSNITKGTHTRKTWINRLELAFKPILKPFEVK